jgi:predicted component of type VI protein secretion system
LGNIPEFRKKLQELLDDVATREKLLKELGISEQGEGESKDKS